MTNCPSIFIEKTIFCQSNCIGPFVQCHLTINVKIYFWTLNSVFLIYIFILMYVLCCLIYFICFIVSFKISYWNSSNFFLFKIVLLLLGVFTSSVNFSISLSISTNLILWNLQINWGIIAFLTVLNFLIHKPGTSFHLFRF